MQLSSTLRGTLDIIIACLLWAFSGVALKFLMGHLSPLLVIIVSILGMALSIVYRPQYLKQMIVEIRKHPRDFLVLAFTGVVMGTLCYYLTLSRLSLSLTTSLVRLEPLFILLVAHWWIKEKLHGWQFIFAITAFVGITMLLWPELTAIFVEHQQADFLPLLFMFISIIGYAISTVQAKVLANRNYSPFIFIGARFGIGFFLCLPFLLTVPASDYFQAPWWAWVLTLANAMLLSTFGFVFYYRGLANVSASVSGFMEQFSPIFGIILSWLILHEQLLVVQYLGAVVLIVSMSMLGYLEHRAKTVGEIIL